MKIIDILVKIANTTLEDEFKFVFDDEVFRYDKEMNKIVNKYNQSIEEKYDLVRCLNDEIELIQKGSTEQ